MQAAVEEFTQNPFWKQYLETAPSEQCKEYIRLEFCYSSLAIAGNDERDEVAETMDKLKTGFTVADWKHLKRYAGHNPFYTECNRMIEKLSQEG